MPENSIRVYPYRWVVLGAFMLINLTLQILWICFAPITGPAATFYGVSDLQIGFLAMSFMFVYIPLSIPASWAIDTFGYRKAVGFGMITRGGFQSLARCLRHKLHRRSSCHDGDCHRATICDECSQYGGS